MNKLNYIVLVTYYGDSHEIAAAAFLTEADALDFATVCERGPEDVHNVRVVSANVSVEVAA